MASIQCCKGMKDEIKVSRRHAACEGVNIMEMINEVFFSMEILNWIYLSQNKKHGNQSSDSIHGTEFYQLNN
jgi:hypothetical protein